MLLNIIRRAKHRSRRRTPLFRPRDARPVLGEFDVDGWREPYAGATSPEEANLLFRSQGGGKFANTGKGRAMIAPGRSAAPVELASAWAFRESHIVYVAVMSGEKDVS